MRSIGRGLVGMGVLAMALVAARPAAAQVKGIELNGFGGLYAPTDKEGLEGTREALRRGSTAFGGRLTWWTGKALGIEAVGVFSPARLKVTANSGSQFVRSTEVMLGAGKLMFNLTPGSKVLGIAIGGGPALIHTKETVFDPARSQSDIGGVAGLSLRLGLGENVALRGDFEDFFYGGDFGRGSKFTQDLVVSAGLSIKL